MTFWEPFFKVLIRRPVPALSALYWHLTRRRVRARNRLRAATADLPFAYDSWIKSNECPRELEISCRETIKTWDTPPRFAVVVYSETKLLDGALRRSLDSVRRQAYPAWDCQTLNGQPFERSSFPKDADFIVLLRAGDVLARGALFHFGDTLQRTPEADILYGDQDTLTGRGRRIRPWFKPKWNNELFYAQDYISPAVALNGNLVRNVVRAPSTATELLLEATAAASSIVHVPHVTCHVPDSQSPVPNRVDAVARHLRPRGATCQPGPFGTVHVHWPLPRELPLVSIVIPTRDKADLLNDCVKSVLERTEYDRFEIILVDNGSVEERTHSFLRQFSRNKRVKVLDYNRPFNYSAINNFAVEHAKGSHLCLLNNDTEVIEPAWLTELMRYGVRQEIGAVGAKLLYEDGSIQHAGVVVGMGEAAGHAHRFLAAGEPGYFRQAHLSQYVSAVTGACLLVEKWKYRAVGGLDQEKLAVAFNDVDLCLKLQSAGWRNVYVPHAVLLHHESKSRGSDMERSQRDRFMRELEVLQQRWATKNYDDPLHHPNLDRYSETYVPKSHS